MEPRHAILGKAETVSQFGTCESSVTHEISVPMLCQTTSSLYEQAASRHPAEDACCWEPRTVLIPHLFGMEHFLQNASCYSSSRLQHLLGNTLIYKH